MVVTGASRGLGAEVAKQLAAQVSADAAVRMLLLGRSESGLAVTRDAVLKLRGKAHVVTTPADMSTDHDYSGVLSTGLGKEGTATHAILVSNAGDLGELGPVSSFTAAGVARSMAVNVTQPLLLTTAFLQRYSKCARVTLINVSSLCALKAFPGWGQYCAGKAARDMLHMVVAEEAKTSGNAERVRTLNYAPGILDTDMQKAARSSDTDFRDNTSFYNSVYDKFRAQGPDAALPEGAAPMITASRSARLLARIVVSGDFESGSHVDFYDHKWAKEV